MSEYSDNDFGSSGSEGGGGQEETPSPVSSLGRLAAEALQNGEFKSARTKDGREYWYCTETREPTWDLKRTMASRRASASEAQRIDLSTTNSSILRRRVERQASTERTELLPPAPVSNPANSNSNPHSAAHSPDNTPGVSPIREARGEEEGSTLSLNFATPPQGNSPPALSRVHSEKIEVEVKPVEKEKEKEKEVEKVPPSAVRAQPRPVVATVDSSDFSDVNDTPVRPHHHHVAIPQAIPHTAVTTPASPSRPATPDAVAHQGHGGIPPVPSPLRVAGGRPLPAHSPATVSATPILPTRDSSQPLEEHVQGMGPTQADPQLLTHLMQAYHDVIVANARGASQGAHPPHPAPQVVPLQASGVQKLQETQNTGGAELHSMHHAFERQSVANREVEEGILDLVLGMMHSGTGERRLTAGTGRELSFFELCKASSRRDADHMSQTAQTHHHHNPSATYDSVLLGSSGLPSQPERRSRGARPIAPPPPGGWADGGIFHDKGSLTELCCSNLKKYVVRHTGRRGGEAERALLVDASSVVLQMVQNQGNKNHPVASYFVQYAGAHDFKVLAQSVMHSLPFERVAKGDSYRLEYWVTRVHMVEVAMALQATIRLIDSAAVSSHYDGLRGPSQAKEAPEPAAVVEALGTLHDTPMFRLQVADNRAGDNHSLLEEQEGVPSSANPFLNQQIMANLTSEIKLQGYAKTGTHVSAPTVSAFLSHTLQEILLDDVVKGAVVNRTLKKMGIQTGKPQTQGT